MDGGHGGGQLLRTALSVSACTGVAVRIKNIRAKRPKPGLQPQHVKCVHALQNITNATVTGAAIGATELWFQPNAPKAGTYDFDIGTAGSTALLLQCILPPLLLAGTQSRLTLRGGTDVPFAPPSFFMERAFPKALESFGARVQIRVARHGFYPQGGGVLEANITPSNGFKAADFLKRPKPTPTATILSAKLPSHVAERENTALEETFPKASTQSVDAASPGNLVFLERDQFNVFSALGKPGKKAEAVANDALDAYHAFEAGTDALEPHVLDQLLLYAALAQGESRFAVSALSEHAKTNLDALHTLLGTPFTHARGVLCVKGKATETRFM